MPEFHEEFDGTAADAQSAAEPLSSDTQNVDAGGVGLGPDTAEPELAEALEGAVVTEPEAEPEDKAAQYLAMAQRTQADFENYRKRAARDAALAQQRGITKLATAMLPALDNLQRALAHASADDPLLEGIKLVHADLQNALTRSGIEAFDPAGESFDPNLHEAVAQFPKEGAEPGTVVEVYQQGYRLGDTVLRPARVVVAA